MPYASIVLDIPTRALDGAYGYRVPPDLTDEVAVGATVLVDFSHRAAVGYVVGVSQEAPEGVNPEKVKDVQQVLAPPAFDETAARVIEWLAREYACPLSEAVRAAVDFTVAAICTTAKAGTDIRYGVNFEANLPVYMRALGIL